MSDRTWEMDGVSVDALHRREGLRLQRFLLRMLGNPADAADATQETYLRMLAALSRSGARFDEAETGSSRGSASKQEASGEIRPNRAGHGARVEHPTALLFRIAHNVALRTRNRHRLERRLFADEGEADLAEIADGFALPERQLIARQELKRLAAAVDELPPRCREVFLMSRFDHLANGDIAARLGISRNMVEKHIIRALLHCRRRQLDPS